MLEAVNAAVHDIAEGVLAVKVTKSVGHWFYLIAVSLVAAIGVYGYNEGAAARRAQAAIAAIEELGGCVYAEDRNSDRPVARVEFSRCLCWTEDEVGLVTESRATQINELADRTVGYLTNSSATDSGRLDAGQAINRLGDFADGSNITDADLVHLTALTHLQTLSLDHTKISGTGLEHLERLTHLRQLNLSGSQIGDAGLEHARGLTGLHVLGLERTGITGTGLKYLRGMDNLQVLFLDETQISDAGLVNLKGLTKLECLHLTSTPITDAGLVHLKGLTNLQYLSLNDTQVTREGANKLKQSLPKCVIGLFY